MFQDKFRYFWPAYLVYNVDPMMGTTTACNLLCNPFVILYPSQPLTQWCDDGAGHTGHSHCIASRHLYGVRGGGHQSTDQAGLSPRWLGRQRLYYTAVQQHRNVDHLNGHAPCVRDVPAHLQGTTVVQRVDGD